MTDLPDVRSLAVLGLGRSGVPAALLASRRLPGVTVTALDEGRPADDDAPALLGAAGVAVLLGRDARLPAACDLLVKSPGVPNESPVVREAQARGVPVWSEVEFATRFLPNRLVAITGTNGKTTTTELTGAILRDAGVPVAVAGNVGHALSRLPDEVGDGRHHRRRALELPARAHRAPAARRGRAAQPDAGPHRPARQPGRLRAGQAAPLREPGRGRPGAVQRR